MTERVAQSPAPAHVVRDDAEALAIAERLAADFLRGAGECDRTGRLPLAELDAYSQSGLWSMNVPTAYGGPGLSSVTVARVFSIVAAGDASIAQIARNHVSLIDTLRCDPDESRKRFLLGEALRGIRFGSALAEPDGETVLDMKTRLVREDRETFSLTGRKLYATAALYADLVPVHALDEESRPMLAFVARDAAGLEVADDWTGAGQRTTARGTVILDRVRVAADHVVPVHLAFGVASVHGAVAQIIRAAIDCGIAHRGIEEAMAFVRDHGRPWIDSGRDKAADDPFILREVASLKIKLHMAEALLAKAGQAVDAGLRDENADTAAAASIAVAQAQVLTTEVAVEAGSKLFELSGTRTALSALSLDQHWRDARVHTLHDPARWKLFAIGDYVVNGRKPPRRSWL